MNNSKLQDIKSRSFLFSLRVIKFIESLKKDITTNVIASQLLRCSTSIGANIVEAKSASSRKDFINYYQIALKSANETRYWILLLKHANKTHDKITDDILIEIEEICKILAKSIITLKGR